jgi:serine/threonine protein kinase
MFVRINIFLQKFKDIINLVFTSFKDESNIYLVLEFITGGKIFIIIKQKKTKEFQGIFFLICKYANDLIKMKRDFISDKLF